MADAVSAPTAKSGNTVLRQDVDRFSGPIFFRSGSEVGEGKDPGRSTTLLVEDEGDHS